MIDVSALATGDDGITEVASQIDRACRAFGFFYVVGHGVPEDVQDELDAAARRFFALPEPTKAEIAMPRGGLAWRGWFPLEGELTSGRPDRKEGLYFGEELGPDDPRVVRGTPLHGANLFPAQVPELRTAVLSFLEAMTALGHRLMGAMAVGLGLDADWFARHLTADPLVLFRIFRYPPESGLTDPGWGVAEHTDYGLLTMLQDSSGGLQVRAPAGWIDAPPIRGSLVCNLGDMLERMTAGRYRSTPHRVRNTGEDDRLSFPFFFDPAWDAEVLPVPSLGEAPAPARPRWDGEDVTKWSGTYGDHLWTKVGRVFPDLRQRL